MAQADPTVLGRVDTPRGAHRSSRDARFDLEVGGRTWFFYTVERLGAGDYCRAFA
jgi:hypothetical protein